MLLEDFLKQFSEEEKVIMVLKKIIEADSDIEQGTIGLINRLYYNTNVDRIVIKDVLKNLKNINWERFLSENRILIKKRYLEIVIKKVNNRLKKIWDNDS